MFDEDDELERKAHRAGILSAKVAVLGVALTFVGLCWGVFTYLAPNEAPGPSESTSSSTGAEKDSAKDSKQQETEDGSDPLTDVRTYFKEAATDTDHWRADQNWGLLIVWWVVAVIAFIYFSKDNWWFFRVAAISQGTYLLVFWPSLSGFGIGLSTGLMITLAIVAHLETG